MSKKVPQKPGSGPSDREGNPYKVGFGKPPLHSQWRKGQSGNPDGRAQGGLNLKTIGSMLAEELAELVSVQGPDGKRKVTKQRAYFKKLINDALTGNARDKKILMDVMLKLAELFSPDEAPAEESIPGAENALERYVRRAIRQKRLEDDASADDPDDEEDVR